MHNFSHSSTRSQTRSRRLSVATVLLTGCLFLLSSCSGVGSSSPANGDTHNGSVAYRAMSVSALLQEQGVMELEALQQWVALMRQYKGNDNTYQQELSKDQKALDAAHTDSAYQQVLRRLDQQVKDIEIPALKSEASDLEKQLAQQAAAWGQQHTYHDSYNNTTYPLAYEYGPNGVDGFVQDDLSGAQTAADYQQAVEDADMYLANLQAYKTNASDKTPWNQPHATDLQLMQHYHTSDQKVVVVSLGEQTLRVYNNGHLIKAFKVTTGRPEKPSLPGAWSIENKQSPTIFRSDEPRNSPYWYPDTPINYAMLYHSGGYYIHDSWWRADYGVGTQFPHEDSSGDSFSFDGSHGCINISKDDAAWLYSYVDMNTRVIVY
jgi:lipoprotein-anchoring transpeptidase ErfK/SrfK